MAWGRRSLTDKHYAGFRAAEFLKRNHWHIDDVRHSNCPSHPIYEPSKRLREEKRFRKDDRHSLTVPQQIKTAFKKRDAKLLFDETIRWLPYAIDEGPSRRCLEALLLANRKGDGKVLTK